MGRYPLSGSTFQREQKPHQGNMKEYLEPFLEVFHNINLIILKKIKPFHFVIFQRKYSHESSCAVDELIRDSPEPELELSHTEAAGAGPHHDSVENVSNSPEKHAHGRKTPSGRRTPICGKNRHRHRSTGSSPAPSVKSHHNQPAETETSSPKLSHQRTLSQPDTTSSTNNGGYEPVGQARHQAMKSSQSAGRLPQGRPPDSELPTLPREEGDSDTTEEDGCFSMRKSKSRSRSRERKVKKSSARSNSRDSRCSEHPYETPKLLPKNKSKPTASETTFSYDTSLVEYGYEPVGRRVVNDVSIRESNEILTGAETVQHLSRQNGKCETSLEEGNNAKSKISSKSFIDTIIDKVKLLSKEESKNVNETENLEEKKESQQDGATFEEIDLKENTDNITVQNEGEAKLEESKLDEKQREKDQKMIMKNLKKEREEEIKRNKEEEKRKKKEKEQEERKMKEEEQKRQKLAKEEEKKIIKLAKETEQAERKAKEEEMRQQKLAREEEKKKLKLAKEAELAEKKVKEEEIKLAKEEEKKKLKLAKEAEQKRLKEAKEEKIMEKKHLKEAKAEEKKNQVHGIFDKEVECVGETVSPDHDKEVKKEELIYADGVSRQPLIK